MPTPDPTPVPASYADSVLPESREWRIDFVDAQRERRCYVDFDDDVQEFDLDDLWAA